MDLMDPNLHLILQALATVGKDTASEAIKDAYHGLRDLVKHKLANKQDAETVLARYEQQPQVWLEPLRTQLVEVDAAQDQEIVQAAQHLLTLVNPQQAGMGKFNTQITGNLQGFVQGDQSQVTMNFGDKLPEK